MKPGSSRAASSPRRLADARRAPRSRSSGVGTPSPRVAAAMRAISAASAICPSESRNLAGASPMSSVPASAAQAARRSAKRRHRRVDGEAPRRRRARSRRRDVPAQQQDALGARRAGPAPRAGARRARARSRPSKHEARLGERGGERGVADGLAVERVRHGDEQQRLPERHGQEGRRVGPGEHDRDVARGAEQGAQVGHGRRPARRRTAAARRPAAARRRRDARRARRSAGTPRAARRPSRRARRAASGRCPGRAAAARRARRSGAVGLEARRARRRGRRPRRRAGADEARARELAGDVVLQVGVQPAVARVELRRRAERQHRRVEQVEPEPLGRRVRGARRGPRASPSRARLSARSSET